MFIILTFYVLEKWERVLDRAEVLKGIFTVSMIYNRDITCSLWENYKVKYINQFKSSQSIIDEVASLEAQILSYEYDNFNE